jgi:hypothetical protein
MPSGLWHYKFIARLLQGLYKNSNKNEYKNADKLRRFLEDPSCRRLADFVWPQASFPRTTKNKPAHCCMPIIDSEKFFLRTLKCYSRWSWARDHEDSKSKPMVRARNHRDGGDPSLVVGRGRVSWTMLSLIALTRQKKAESQPALLFLKEQSFR